MNTNRIGAAVFLVVVLSAAGEAQRPEDARRPGKRSQPARVALVTSAVSLGDAHVRVLRRNSMRPHEVVIVDAQASARDLASGLQLLAMLRAEFGDSLTRDMRATPTSFDPPTDWRGSPYERWMDQQLIRLRAARQYRVAGIGTAKAVTITLPAARGRIVAATKK